MRYYSSFYYPTKILLIDDSEEFLKSISLKLPYQTNSYSYFSDPKLALSFLNDEYQPKILCNSVVETIDEKAFEHRSIDININELYKNIYAPGRFNQISTIIVDYDMPPLNGLEFCKNILHPNIQKILLTGQADEQVAINAFNEGVISQFIKKQDIDIFEKLKKAITLANNKFFISCSNLIIDIIKIDKSRPTALSDNLFLEYFESILQTYNIVEYYLFESVGSFVLVDANGKIYNLYVQTEEQNNAIFELAEEEDPTNFSLLNVLKSQKKIFCYYDKVAFPEISAWEKHLYPAIKIKGQLNYYVALMKNILDINQHQIYSFNNYKNDLLSEKS